MLNSWWGWGRKRAKISPQVLPGAMMLQWDRCWYSWQREEILAEEGVGVVVWRVGSALNPLNFKYIWDRLVWILNNLLVLSNPYGPSGYSESHRCSPWSWPTTPWIQGISYKGRRRREHGCIRTFPVLTFILEFELSIRPCLGSLIPHREPGKE